MAGLGLPAAAAGGDEGAAVMGRCVSCLFWHRQSGASTVPFPHDIGTCQRRAPIAAKEPSMSQRAGEGAWQKDCVWVAAFPGTRAQDGCGEYVVGADWPRNG